MWCSVKTKWYSSLTRKRSLLSTWIYGICKPEVESSRTLLASRTHFEVLGLGHEGQVLGLGLGLKASSPWKLACPRLEDSTIFWTFEISLENVKNLAENLRTPCFVFLTWSIGVAKGGRGSLPLPPNQNFTNDKNVTKKSIVFSVSVSFQHFSLTTVTNNNVEDQGCRVLPTSIFASQFKRITRRKWRVFVLKIAISGPHLAFSWT